MATTDLSEYIPFTIANADEIVIGIVVSEWNSPITNSLLNGALDTLAKEGLKKSNIRVFYVPGSFELSYSCMQLAKSQSYDAIVAIGCVIRGETAHFDYVCSGVTQGIKDVNIITDTPTIFCVLTDDNEEQSISRSGGKFGNKGVEAAVSALKMVEFRRKVKSSEN